MSEEEKKEVMEDAGKWLVWELLGDSREISDMSSDARSIIRKSEDCNLLRITPTKDLVVKYGININRGYTPFVWWLLEQFEKGNVTIKDDVLTK